MAIFPGAHGDDVLAWRGISGFVNRMRERKAQELARLHHEEGVDLLKKVAATLDAELAFEEDFSARFAAKLADLEQSRDESGLKPLLLDLDQLAAEYFIRRGSVIACQTLCNTYRDRIAHIVLQRIETALEREGRGRPPGPYCCLAAGSAGRLEQTFCVDPSWFFIHGGGAAGAEYFSELTDCAAALLTVAGLTKNGNQKPARKVAWSGSRSEWRQETVEKLGRGEQGGVLELVRRADLRHIYGNAALAREMIDTVWSTLGLQKAELRQASQTMAAAGRTRITLSFPLPALRGVAKGLAEMPTGLDFFSRLRLERSGPHRGQFNLAEFAVEPLITNIRMLAIYNGVRETSTIGRIKEMQEQGRLSVELTERLLLGYHDFIRFKIGRQLAAGCEKENQAFIDPQELEEDDRFRLRLGLEAVTDLEKIAYLSFTEHG